MPKPVDDTTQNFGVNGEYKGTSPWGKAFTFKVGYSGSIYEEAQGLTRCRTRSAPQGPVRANARERLTSSPLALMTLWPNNSAHGFNSTIGADLPMKSRYMGTLSYTMDAAERFVHSDYQPPHLHDGQQTLCSARLPGCRRRA